MSDLVEDSSQWILLGEKVEVRRKSYERNTSNESLKGPVRPME